MLKITKSINVDGIFSALERHFDRNFVGQAEQHNFWEMLYVVDGCVGVVAEDKVYELTGGQIIFYEPPVFHKIWAANDAPIHVIMLSFSLTGQGFEDLSKGIFDAGDEEVQLIKSAYSFAQHCFEFEDYIKNQLISNKIEELILRLLEKGSSRSQQKRDKSTEIYKKIVRTMADNLYENLSADQLAKLCDLSLTTLKKTFKTYSGISVMKYYGNLRMQKAIDLMCEGKNMAEISEILNFSSQNYFTEAFKRQCGMTPSEHKRRFVKADIYK